MSFDRLIKNTWPQIGKSFGLWTVNEQSFHPLRGHNFWLCSCSCGTKRGVYGYYLIKGLSKSCGCKRAETAKKNFTKHGKSHSRIHGSWSQMVQRCHNPNDSSYSYYGARGIRVCRRWRKFENFFKDMGQRPKGKTLDRINNKKGYGPKNCKWSTWSEQMKNRNKWYKKNENSRLML